MIMNRYYVAKEGYTYVRKTDGFDMGNELWLGIDDTIDNYLEVEIDKQTYI